MKINRNKISGTFPILEQIILYTACNVEYNIPISRSMKTRTAMYKQARPKLDIF